MTESMRDVFEGIRVKGFILFQDETVEYEILETDEVGNEIKTAPVCLSYIDQMSGMEGMSGYQMLNRMLQSGRSQDVLLDQMQEYAEKRAIVKFLMKPDDGGRGNNDRR